MKTAKLVSELSSALRVNQKLLALIQAKNPKQFTREYDFSTSGDVESEVDFLNKAAELVENELQRISTMIAELT
jgi:hypothetical protein